MLGQVAIEGERQLIDLAAQPAPGEVGHVGGLDAAGGKGAQHQHARDAEHVGHDTRDLDVGALEQAERAVALRCQIANERLAVADEIAQHPHLGRRHEACADKAVAHEIGDPLGVLHVGLAPGHVADVRGIADDQRERAFECCIYRLPINAGAFHADVRHLMREQPVAQGNEIAAHGAEGAHLLPGPALGRTDDDTGDHRALMHIEPGDAFE